MQAAAGKVERYSALKDLAVRGECSRADIYLSVSVCVFTDIIKYEMTHICIRSNSCQLF